MFGNPDDEQDKDPDKKDAHLDKKSEDEEDEDEDDENEDEDENSDDDEDEEDSDEDDDKPITRKELKDILKKNQNNNNASRRVSSKGKRDDIRTPHKPDSRLSALEQSVKKSEFLERKRTFGYENGLSPQETDVVFKLTKRPTKKFLEQPYVKGALSAIREESNVRSNTPGSGGSSFKSASGKAWSDLKPEEKESSFADRRRSILESKKNR